MEEFEEKLKSDDLSMLTAIVFGFSDGMMSVEMGGQTMQEGVISIEEENGKTYMNGGVMGGDRPEISMKDGRLILDIGGDGTIMELKKAE